MSRDVVTFHVETLIERITGTDKARPDDDGDYPAHYRDAAYYVRVAGTDDRPIVRVFSTVVADIKPTHRPLRGDQRYQHATRVLSLLLGKGRGVEVGTRHGT